MALLSLGLDKGDAFSEGTSSARKTLRSYPAVTILSAYQLSQGLLPPEKAIARASKLFH